MSENRDKHHSGLSQERLRRLSRVLHGYAERGEIDDDVLGLAGQSEQKNDFYIALANILLSLTFAHSSNTTRYGEPLRIASLVLLD